MANEVGKAVENILAWHRGWDRFDELKFREGWGADKLKWKFLYAVDVGANVLTGGAVEPLSAMMQTHRDGWLWDKILDTIETIDPDHGKKSLGTSGLWDTTECKPWLRISMTFLWVLIIFGGVKLIV